MLAFPSAKINLGLSILEKRPDQYHNILTCFFPVPLHDILEIVPALSFDFIQTGLEIAGKQEDNLVVRAYQLLQKDHMLPPVKIHLHKLIPMGAGLGGGSSDAVFTLTTLNRMFALKLSDLELESYASLLGSDCAFFVRNRPVIAHGRGEEMAPLALDLKGTYLLLVCPPLHISTSEAYAGVKPAPYVGDFTSLLADPLRWKSELRNQFEASIFPTNTLLSDIKRELYNMGAWYAAMSGSGSTVFGLFTKEVEHHSFSYITFQKVL